MRWWSSWPNEGAPWDGAKLTLEQPSQSRDDYKLALVDWSAGPAPRLGMTLKAPWRSQRVRSTPSPRWGHEANQPPLSDRSSSLAERHLAKVEVEGSSPSGRSNGRIAQTVERRPEESRQPWFDSKSCHQRITAPIKGV